MHSEGTEELMTVGELARRTGLSIKAIRQYEALGLVYSAGRSDGNYRLFDESALWCAQVISTLRSLGLTIKEIDRLGRAYLSRPEEPVGPQLAALLDRAERRHDEPVRGGLERGDPDAAADPSGGALEVGLRRLQSREHRVGVDHQPPARLRELDAAADPLEQRDAGVALERGELLGDRRGRVGERLGDGRDRAPRRELAQQPQPADVEQGVGRPAVAFMKLSLQVPSTNTRWT
jgi:DNA-binding transcriptional MerR regulator